MKFIFPLSLLNIVDAAYDDEPLKYRMDTVCLDVREGGAISIVATDGRMLVEIYGFVTAVPEFAGHQFLIPARAWQKFRIILNLLHFRRPAEFFVEIEGKGFRLSAIDKDNHEQAISGALTDGTFPPYRLLTTAATDKPGEKIVYSPKLLSDLLACMSATLESDDDYWPNCEPAIRGEMTYWTAMKKIDENNRLFARGLLMGMK